MPAVIRIFQCSEHGAASSSWARTSRLTPSSRPGYASLPAGTVILSFPSADVVGEQLLREVRPEVLERGRLTGRPCDELIEDPDVQPGVAFGQHPERPPPGRLAFHTEPEDLRLFEAAQRGPGEQAAVELQAANLLPGPRGEHLVAAQRDVQPRHDL